MPDILNRAIEMYKSKLVSSKINIDAEGGAKEKHKHMYKGRAYIVRTGTKGGKYILVQKTKIYV